jgi:tetratricopeptide (TPR) repeat protein
MKYAQGLFSEAIGKAEQCLAAPQPYWKLYGILAYAQNKLGDSLKAKASFDQYFSKAKPDQIGMGDYSTYANVLFKFPGNDSLAGTYVDKAVSLDSVEANKVTYLKSIASYYEGQKKFKEAADWYNKIVSVKKNLTKTDLYNAGYNYFRAGVYQPAIDVFNLYNQKFPEDPFGHYMIGKSNWAIDSTMEQGLANPAFEKAIEVGQSDRNKYKNQLVGSYKYFVAYYANIKKDKQMAINYCDSVLAIDPADAEALNNKTVIGQMNMNAPASKPTKAPAKPAEKGTKPKSPEAK